MTEYKTLEEMEHYILQAVQDAQQAAEQLRQEVTEQTAIVQELQAAAEQARQSLDFGKYEKAQDKANKELRKLTFLQEMLQQKESGKQVTEQEYNDLSQRLLDEYQQIGLEQRQRIAEHMTAIRDIYQEHKALTQRANNVLSALQMKLFKEFPLYRWDRLEYINKPLQDAVAAQCGPQYENLLCHISRGGNINDPAAKLPQVCKTIYDL